MTDAITFKRRGDILRGKYRVGWINRCDHADGHPCWVLRYTPASGLTVPIVHYGMLRLAKAEALKQLGGPLPGLQEG